MSMIWGSRRLGQAILAGSLIWAGTAGAQNEPAPATVEALQQSQEQMKQELTAIRQEIKAVRSDLRKVLVQLRSVQAAKGRPQKPAPRPPDTTVYDIEIGDSPIRGPKDAPVTVVEYASFACGWCVKEAPTIKKVMETYPGKVRWVMKNYPMWDRAKPSHAAAVLAQKQKGNDGFWKMHDLILAGRTLDVPGLRKHAEAIGMDLAEFDAVIGDKAKMEALAMADTPGGAKVNVRGTPSVYVNGKRLSPRNFEGYKARIDAILKQKEAKK
ncbi:MAG: DsbA family protein [Phycisphaerae bacterium]